MCRYPFPLSGAFHDHLATGVGQAVQEPVSKNVIPETAEGLVDGAVSADVEAARPTVVGHKLVQILQLVIAQPMQTEFVEYERSEREGGLASAIPRVVHLGLDHGVRKVRGDMPGQGGDPGPQLKLYGQGGRFGNSGHGCFPVAGPGGIR